MSSTTLEDAGLNPLRQRQRLSLPYDYIVCGAGSAGSVAAARLAESGAHRVLLIEAGGSDETPLVMDPDRWPQTLGTDLDWGFTAEPNPRLEGRSIAYGMGKVLGGGSSINVSTWSRGHKADWDFYAQEAAEPAWGYDSVLELYLSAIESWTGAPDPRHRGLQGRVHVQPAPAPHPFAAALLEAAQSRGVPRFPDANGAMMEAEGGCAWSEETIHEGRRCSIFRSYVQPLLMCDNLTVLTGAKVTRIVLEGDRAVAVECVLEGRLHTLRVEREIILSLGAIHTPKTLMLSGIGEGTQLRDAGISPRHELPGVGRGLHDHVLFGCTWESADHTVPTIPRSQTATFWKTDARLDSPNVYAYARRGPAITPENRAHYEMPPGTWSLTVGMRLASRGSVRLTGADVTAPVRIDTGYLTDPQDLKDLVVGISMAREIGNAPALRPFTRREVAPGPRGLSQLQEYLRRGLGTFWHQSGTARMGRDPLSVVDGQLRVHGIQGLRVADASIMPRVTSGNTMAPCVVIGEQLARFLMRS